MEEGNQSTDEVVVLARAKFPFSGKNNDELTFNKNDIITITQQIEGGWWEGTIDGQTGWFPSNYAEILTDKDKLMRSRSVPNAPAFVNGEGSNGHLVEGDLSGSSNQFRAEVLRELIVSETAYILRLKDVYTNYLLPLKDSKILDTDDYATLQCNIDKILLLQSSVLMKLEENSNLPVAQQRIGHVFIESARDLKELLLTYCWNHPRAVEIMNEKDTELRNLFTSMGKEMKGLIMGLSEPFRRLEKYPVVLQELERSVQESHVDRGDIQRSCAVYKDIRALCEAARKQKETQLEFLYTRQVEKWATFDERGKILYVGTGGVVQSDGTRHDRCIVVFSNLLLILELTPEPNVYKLVTKVPCNELSIRKVDDGIAFSGKENFTLNLKLSFEIDRWMESIAKAEGIKVEEGMTVSSRPPTPQKFTIQSMGTISPLRTPDVSQLPVAARARVAKKPSFGVGDLRLNHELEMIVPEGLEDLNSSGGTRASVERRSGGLRIRPSSHHRVFMESLDNQRKGVKLRKEPPINDADDTLLLKIVEGYCNGMGKKFSMSDSRPPQLIVAEEEKILMEEVVGDEIVFQEKSLVDTVYALKDQLSSLRQEMQSLHKTVEKEQKARRRLEQSLRKEGGLPATLSTGEAVEPVG